MVKRKAPGAGGGGGGGAGLDGEEDFPRGGASVLTPLELREAREEAERDFFRSSGGAAEAGGGVKRRKKKDITLDNDGDAAVDADDGAFLSSVGAKLPKHVGLLTFRGLAVGMKLWGMVAEISRKDLTISLPNGLRGFVPDKLASDVLASTRNEDDDEESAPKLADLFKEGQLVQCVVIGLGETKQKKDSSKGDGRKAGKRIELSMLLSAVNDGLGFDTLHQDAVVTACVKSVEDHGCVLAFGPPKITGFLLNSDRQPSADTTAPSPLQEGQLVSVIVKSVDKAKRLVSVREDVKAAATTAVKEVEGLTLQSLTPGMLVNARVRAVLPDGLLCLFLTYFTGTVDIYHLDDICPSQSLSQQFAVNRRLRVRILYIDVLTKRIGLTLQPRLLDLSPILQRLPIGAMVENAVIKRIDADVGMLLEAPDRVGAYVHISNVSDEKVDKLDKQYKKGQKVKGRVIGFRPMDDLLNVALKPSVVEQNILSIADMKPGMMVKAMVVSVHPFGVFFAITDGVKALCPMTHLSDVPMLKPSSKFKAGAKMRVRVLSVDPNEKKVVVTHKKTLMNSKLPVLADYAHAMEGVVTHGVITGVQEYGCFVSFYGNVRGLAHRSELGIGPTDNPADCFKVGQVVKCRVVRANPQEERIALSFMTTRTTDNNGTTHTNPQFSALHDIHTGSMVSGTVRAMKADRDRLVVNVPAGDVFVKGVLLFSHLSDNKEHAEALSQLLRVGDELPRLLVLHKDESKGMLHLSMKPLLIASAEVMPKSVSDLRQRGIYHGFVASINAHGVFVRFLNNVTGLATIGQLADTFVSDVSQHFSAGQTVRAQVLETDESTNKFQLSLKQSACASSDATLMEHYYMEERRIAELKARAEEGGEEGSLKWEKEFRVGEMKDAVVREVLDYGIVLDFPTHGDLVGFAARHQVEDDVNAGDEVVTRVLDVNLREGIVDVSLKKALVTAAGGSRRKASAKLQGIVQGIVELVKADYLVLSLPEYEHKVAFAATKDYNLQLVDAHTRFHPGQHLQAAVHAAMGERVLVHVTVASDKPVQSNKFPGRRVRNTPPVHSLVECKVTTLHALYADVIVGYHIRGRIHVSEATDEPEPGTNPLASFLKSGQTVTAKVLGLVGNPASNPAKHDARLELTIKSSELATATMPAVDPEVNANNVDNPGADADADADSAGNIGVSLETIAVGQHIWGFVQELSDNWLWVVLSPHVRGRMRPLKHVGKRSLEPGSALKCRVTSRDLSRRTLDLILAKDDDAARMGTAAASDEQVVPGAVLTGQVTKVNHGDGVIVQISPNKFGRVHVTDIADKYWNKPLNGCAPGRFFRCVVLQVSGDNKVDLSSRVSLGGCGGAMALEPHDAKNEVEAMRVQSISDLHPGMQVHGFVKSSTGVGCFVHLSRNITARVKISELSDLFIPDPVSEFPPGTLVCGTVLSADTLSNRVELTLKSKSTSHMSLKDFTPGQRVKGVVRRVESYGVFITVLDTSLTGLCHISEAGDTFIKDLQSKFKPGDRVDAVVVQVDVDANRLSFSMKPSRMHGDEDMVVDDNINEEGREQESAVELDLEEDVDEEEEAEAMDEEAEVVDAGDGTNETDEDADEEVDHEEEDEADMHGARNADEDDVAPLEVDLDDNAFASNRQNEDEHQDAADDDDGANAVKKKRSRRAKLHEREEREAAIRAAEQARLDGAAPATTEDYERLVAASPNSSYMWIRYMAFLISLTEVDKARAVAERALNTIHYREEEEKMNVWVAYLNLENTYGSPPKEAVMKLFQRALQQTDPKKLHLALIGIFERTQQPDMALQMLTAATKKFNTSAKVWLRLIACHLKQGDGDAAKRVLERSLASLPKRKHVKVISRAGVLEYKQGSPDRARAIFEGILQNYPKRVDLWSIYLDQEIRLGDQKLVRLLFERATSLELAPKKMKFLFKRYLEYEKAHGDGSSLEHVKTKAMEYVESKVAT